MNYILDKSDITLKSMNARFITKIEFNEEYHDGMITQYVIAPKVDIPKERHTLSDEHNN